MRDRHIFIWQSLDIFNVFSTLTLKQIFWKMKTFLKNLEHCFLIESTKIETVSFPYKIALSEATVKINRVGSTKWTCNKERNFVSNYFIFSKLCFSLRTFYKELIWCTNYPNVHIHTFCKGWSFISRYFFPVSILKHPVAISIQSWGKSLCKRSGSDKRPGSFIHFSVPYFQFRSQAH